jgi:hypothetical protein
MINFYENMEININNDFDQPLIAIIKSKLNQKINLKMNLVLYIYKYHVALQLIDSNQNILSYHSKFMLIFRSILKIKV